MKAAANRAERVRRFGQLASSVRKRAAINIHKGQPRAVQLRRRRAHCRSRNERALAAAARKGAHYLKKLHAGAQGRGAHVDKSLYIAAAAGTRWPQAPAGARLAGMVAEHELRGDAAPPHPTPALTCTGRGRWPAGCRSARCPPQSCASTASAGGQRGQVGQGTRGGSQPPHSSQQGCRQCYWPCSRP